MDNNEIKTPGELSNETPIDIETGTDAQPSIEALAAADELPPVIAEEELVKLAANEGLFELEVQAEASNETTEGSATSAIELTPEQEAHLSASMETILFMSDKPVSLPKLRSVLSPEVPLPVFRKLMANLRQGYEQDSRGIEIAEVSMGFQLRTKPHMSSVLRKLVKTQPLKLSPTTLEVLAMVAYKQPITKDEIDVLRGVDSGYVLRSLMERRLVKISGRSDLPGRPMLYSTTHEFLELFCLKDLKSLPALHEIEAMVAASEVGTEEKAQLVMDEFSKVLEQNKKVLFDDSQIDTELEALKAEIASIPTSTDFIDLQKRKEKLTAKLAELAAQGMTLDINENVVPLGHETAIKDISEILTEPEIPTLEQNADSSEVIESTEISSISSEVKEISAAESIDSASTESESPTYPEISADGPVPDIDQTDYPSITAEQAHEPSAELQAEANAAQWERHAEMIASALAEAETSKLNLEALASPALENSSPSEEKAEENQEDKGLSPEDL